MMSKLQGHAFNVAIYQSAERIVAALFVHRMIVIAAFTQNTYAYLPVQGIRTALAVLITT